jgi:hypothetical protein
MELVHEHEGPLPGRPAMPIGGRHDLTDLLDPGEDGRKGNERAARGGAQEPGERRLPGTGRTPEYERMKLPAFPCGAERPARTEQIILAEDVGDVGGADPICEGRVPGRDPWVLKSSSEGADS